MKTGAVEFEWVRTNEMAADELTKTISSEKFTSFMSQIGVP